MNFTMDNNRFYNARMDIKKLAENRHVTVDVATQMYITETGIEDYKIELNDWTNLCTKYMTDPHKTLADLFR